MLINQQIFSFEFVLIGLRRENVIVDVQSMIELLDMSTGNRSWQHDLFSFCIASR